MDKTTAILVALGILILFALVFKGAIFVKLWGFVFKTKSDSQHSNPGAVIRDAQAGGNITADDQIGRGAEISRAKAGGDITASSSAPSKPPPKAQPPGTPAGTGGDFISGAQAGHDIIQKRVEVEYHYHEATPCAPGDSSILQPSAAQDSGSNNAEQNAAHDVNELPVEYKHIEIRIKMTPEEFERMKKWICEGMQQTLGAQECTFRVTDVRRGSTIASIMMPSALAERAKSAMADENSELRKYLAGFESLTPFHQLPPPLPVYASAGRSAELAALCRSIRDRAKEGKPTAIVRAIEGMGGVGKTELAIAAAYELASDFPEAQIILQLAAHSTNPATPAQVRDDLLHKVHPDAKLPEDDGALWKLYQNIFRDDNGQPRRMLVILDDVADDDQVRALMPPPGCAVLITSRRALASCEPLHLTTFFRPEAIALLRSFRKDLTEADAGAVAELCGFLPVALQAAGGFLKCHASKPAAEYVAELRGDPLNRLHHEDAQFDVNVVFERSLRDMTAPQRAAFHRL
ncbi:MAG: NB-ARC domain-containing protein, partial [Verrucomicrobiia bacterium]